MTGYADGAYRIDVTVYDALWRRLFPAPPAAATSSSGAVCGDAGGQPVRAGTGQQYVNRPSRWIAVCWHSPTCNCAAPLRRWRRQHGAGEERQLSLYLPEQSGQHRQRATRRCLRSLAFAGAQLGNGYQNVDCSTFNDKLYLGYDRGLTTDQSASRRVAIFDIAGGTPANPVPAEPDTTGHYRQTVWQQVHVRRVTRLHADGDLLLQPRPAVHLLNSMAICSSLISRRRSARPLSGELFHAFAPPATSLTTSPTRAARTLVFGLRRYRPAAGCFATTTSSDGNFCRRWARLHAIDLDGLDSIIRGSKATLHPQRSMSPRRNCSPVSACRDRRPPSAIRLASTTH